MKSPDIDVAIVGGGPVGLFLGIRLAMDGIRFRILERLESPVQHTRSIGIHPPALELMADVGIADRLIEKGIPVTEGLAFGNRRPLGSLSFSSCPPPFRFVLSIPQYETESVLETALLKLAPEGLQRGIRVEGIRQESGAVRISCVQGDEHTMLSARIVVACDGKDSVVREALGIPWIGAPYEDTYIMGDFPDDTALGPRAAIYLADEGLVESFPLPGATRRWVVKTNEYVHGPSAADIREHVRRRTGHRVAPGPATRVSAFGVQHYLADSFVRGRVLLAGDAAHVVSPIGGQGMNLGWLDASETAHAIVHVLRGGCAAQTVFSQYHYSRRSAARSAIRRAEFNMTMGRRTAFPALKYIGVGGVLHSPLRYLFARLFTMRGL